MRLEKLGSILTAIALALACNVARGSLETTAGVTVDGKVVTDLDLTLGADPWTYQIEVYGKLASNSGGKTGFNFTESDGIQSWDTSFKLCPTTGGTALTNDVISVSWVDTGISSAFTTFYQTNLTGTTTAKLATAYTENDDAGNSWTGKIGVWNQKTKQSDVTHVANLTGNVTYRIGTIEISYDPAQYHNIVEGDLGTYALILSDDVTSVIYAAKIDGTDKWRISSEGSVDAPMVTMTLNTLTPEPGPVPDPEPGPVPSPEPGTWAMIAGIAIVGTCCIRRRHAKYRLNCTK
ncbi:MAG: hypothetical protein PHE53_05585 [Thermoguttaceae bacterium]|nr:hypothetical protein [Thermoguttaceae bacterium]